MQTHTYTNAEDILRRRLTARLWYVICPINSPKTYTRKPHP